MKHATALLLLLPALAVGTPVFDYNDGTGQGMVVSGTDGSINWIKLGN